MAHRTFILPYRAGSQSVRALREAMAVKWIKIRNSAYQNRPSDVIINWGANEALDHIPDGARVVNKFRNVAIATNKLLALKTLNNYGVRVPSFTESRETAADFIINGGATIVARTKLRGHGGSGIIMCSTIEELNRVRAPLFTKYIPKKHEYRVHVVNGQVIDVVRKALDKERIEREGIDIDWRIRNHSKGFIFSRDLQPDGTSVMDTVNHDVTEQAINAINALGLDFGAVDVIFNERREMAYVLEVNTAPGIEGTTLSRYAEAFNSMMPRYCAINAFKLLPEERKVDNEALDMIDGEEAVHIPVRATNN